MDCDNIYIKMNVTNKRGATMPHSTRPNSEKYEKILEALRTLLETKKISQISVSEIAQTAGIGKGSIYYYFSSKEAIFDALMAKSYEEPLATAKRTDISPFVRMAMIFQACRNSSAAFLKIQSDAGNGVQENAFLHNKYINYLITELKPVTGEIIRQGAAEGLIVCQQPDALAEIVLLVLVVKLDNTLIPSTKEETEQTISELISLLEKGTDNPEGSLNFLRV
jgi:AcrR family transcriptional regulator